MIINNKIERNLKMKKIKYNDGEPCFHIGCLGHRSHLCEGCGRINGKGIIYDEDWETKYEVEENSMSELIKLSKQDIISNYQSKPILIKDNKGEEWYIVNDVETFMPLDILTGEEAELYEQNEDNISGIKISGVSGDAYLMWIYFDQNDGWVAYGYKN
jgi:hypothetical protein